MNKEGLLQAIKNLVETNVPDLTERKEFFDTLNNAAWDWSDEIPEEDSVEPEEEDED